MPTALLWLRNDLRLHDHAPLGDATEAVGATLAHGRWGKVLLTG